MEKLKIKYEETDDRKLKLQILSLSPYSNEKSKSCINFFYVSADDFKNFEENLNSRLDVPIQPIKGTMSFHRFTPISKDLVEVRCLSSSSNVQIHSLISKSTKTLNMLQEKSKTFKINDFVCCTYDKNVWVGMIEEYNEEFEDYIIKFLHPSGVSPSYYFPPRNDICPISVDNILGSVNATLRPPHRIQYVFSPEELNEYQSVINTL